MKIHKNSVNRACEAALALKKAQVQTAIVQSQQHSNIYIRFPCTLYWLWKLWFFVQLSRNVFNQEHSVFRAIKPMPIYQYSAVALFEVQRMIVFSSPLICSKIDLKILCFAVLPVNILRLYLSSLDVLHGTVFVVRSFVRSPTAQHLY